MVHKQVLKAYQKNKYEYVERSEDLIEKRFWKEISDHDGKLFFHLQHAVTKVVRVKSGTTSGGQEFFYYEDRLRGYNHVGNPKDITVTVGKFLEPTFVRTYDDKTRAIIGLQISQHETKYELPWTPKNWAKVKKMLSYDEVTFYAEVPGRRYRIFTLEEFEDGTYEELVRMGRNGKSLAELKLEDAGRSSRKTQSQPSSMWVPPSERITSASKAKVDAMSNPNQQQVLLPRQVGTIRSPKSANVIKPKPQRTEAAKRRRIRVNSSAVTSDDAPSS